MAFRLKSSAFADGESIPVRHTCEGDDVSPPISWAGAPDGTKSFVLICDDPDAPGGTFRHWGAYDIPANRSELPGGFEAAARVGDIGQAVNGFGRTGYGGPCPPPGHGPHRYIFRLIAVSVERIEVGKNPDIADLEAAAKPHALDEARLMGTYERR